jgi:hypothetical protein
MIFLNNKRKKLITLITYFYFGLISFFFLALTSLSTSPFTKHNLHDSSIFQIIGSAIKNGFIPYKDIFDHKGPLLFFIQYLGKLISDERVGIWLIQALFLFFTLIFIYKIAKLFLEDKIALLTPLIYLIINRVYFGNGNLSEEYCMLFVFIATYYWLKILPDKQQQTNPKIPFLIIGASLSAISLIRLNNAAFIVGLLAIYFIFNLKREAFIENIKKATLILAGFTIIAVPFIVYYAVNNALYDMVYGTFIFNFKYSETGYYKLTKLIFQHKLGKQTALSILVVFSGLYLYYKKTKNLEIVLSIILAAILTVISIFLPRRPYSHYLQLTLPLYIFGTILIINSLNLNKIIKPSKHLLIVIFFGLNTFLGWQTILYYQTKKHQATNEYPEAKMIASLIPKSDIKNSTLAYNVTPHWLISADIIPLYTKYFTRQDGWAHFDKTIYAELIQELTQNPPNYVLLDNTLPIQNKEIEKYIKKNYTLIESGDSVMLYKFRLERFTQ